MPVRWSEKIFLFSRKEVYKVDPQVLKYEGGVCSTGEQTATCAPGRHLLTRKKPAGGSHVSLTCVSIRFRVWSNPLLLFSFLFDFLLLDFPFVICSWGDSSPQRAISEGSQPSLSASLCPSLQSRSWVLKKIPLRAVGCYWALSI